MNSLDLDRCRYKSQSVSSIVYFMIHSIVLCVFIVILIVAISARFAVAINNSGSIPMQGNTGGAWGISMFTDRGKYTLGDTVSVTLTGIDRNSSNGLVLEITLEQDPSLNLQFLGELGSTVSYIPSEIGNYTITLYKIGSLGYTPVLTQQFYVEQQKIECKQVLYGNNITIDLGDYGYVNSLPSSLSITFYDSVGNIHKLLYSPIIGSRVDYAPLSTGIYNLSADGTYIDCFDVLGASTGSVQLISSAQSSSSVGLNGSQSNTIGSISDIMSGSYIIPKLSSYDKLGMTLGILAFNASQYNIQDIHGLNNGIVVARTSNYIDGRNSSKLWMFDTENMSAWLIGYNDTAPASDFPIGVKGNYIVWMSENHSTAYLLDTHTMALYFDTVPYFDSSLGEMGQINSTMWNGNSAAATTVGIGWDVLFDNQDFYFSNAASGQVFSDDNLSARDALREKLHLDSLLTPDELTALNFDNADNPTNDPSGQGG